MALKLPKRISGLILSACFAVGIALSSMHDVRAHPHEWIEMQVQIVFSDDGKITGMRHDWLMDEFFSAFALEGVLKRGNEPTASGLEDLGNEMLRNISEINYFIRAMHNTVPVELENHQLTSLVVEDGKLRMIFDVDFARSLTPSVSTLDYKIYDSAFYIEMIHIEGKRPVELINAPQGCGWELEPPEENQALSAFANSLGREESPGMELGAFFAEAVTVSCK
jgi:ABC-type uncharacterized transport system substrate-binding protein